MDLDCILIGFFDICLHWSAAFVSVFLQSFHSKTCFSQVRGHHFSHILGMFCRLRFKCRFLTDFRRFWIPFEGPFGIIFQKTNGSENSFNEKGPPTWKARILNMAGGSQRGRLACALRKQETTVRAQNLARIGFHCFFQKLAWTCCFGWPYLQIFQEDVRTMERIDVESTWSVIWHALGQRPDELIAVIG